MMADATLVAASDTGPAEAGKLPVPLMLLMMDVMQARGRTESLVQMVDELYARADAADQASR